MSLSFFVDNNSSLRYNDIALFTQSFVLVAQLDRALDYESRGRRFESLQAHHLQTLEP